MKTIPSLICAALLAGCASSSGVAQIGGNRFTISTSASPGRGGIPAAKKMAYEEAAAACAKRGGTVAVDSEDNARPSWTDGMANVSLTFQCALKK